jgi:hypothetical protein
MEALAAIRERLNALEVRLGRHEEDSRSRASKHEDDIRELGRLVAELSKTIAVLTARFSLAPPPPPIGQQVMAGTTLAGLLGALVTWLVQRYVGG